MSAPLSKFTPERVKAILADIAECIPYKIAAESNGISNATLYDWIGNGIRDFNDGTDSDYSRLVEALRSIEKKKIGSLRKNIEENEKGHKGAEWVLERCFWKHFSASVPAIEMNERMERIEATQNKGNENGK